MIVGANVQHNILFGKIVAEMLESPHIFHITGSHFFGVANANSDYDFFTQSSEEVEDFLKSLGFVLWSKSKYADQDVVKVFRHIECAIDVQLSENAELRRKVNYYLARRGFSKPSKAQWNQAFETVKLILSV